MVATGEQVIQFKARRAPDALEALTARADHDGLLPLAIHPDDGANLDAPVGGLGVTLDLDRNAVRQLLYQLEREFFANQLGDAKPLAPIGDLPFRVQAPSLRQRLEYLAPQGLDIVGAQR